MHYICVIGLSFAAAVILAVGTPSYLASSLHMSWNEYVRHYIPGERTFRANPSESAVFLREYFRHFRDEALGQQASIYGLFCTHKLEPF